MPSTRKPSPRSCAPPLALPIPTPAEQGAFVIALAARYGRDHGPVTDAPAFLSAIRVHVTDPSLRENLDQLAPHLARGATPHEFACALGLERGVTGFVNHTVPVSLYCWLRYPTDFRRAVESVILLGGDADTTGAIVGGLMGATLGAEAIPEDWLAGLWEWPRSVTWMRQVGACLADGDAAPRLCWPALVPRNLLFTATVLYHGCRRMLPPY